MKKIAIFGSYGGNSIGDTAILLGLISSINRVFNGEVEVNVLSVAPLNLSNELSNLGIRLKLNECIIDNRETSFFPKLVYAAKILINKVKYIFPFKEHEIKKALAGVDYLIIGGGNLIMDYYPRWPTELDKIREIAVKMGVKYSLVGVGLGPINTERGAAVLRKCLIDAEHVYVRDEGSREATASVLNFKKSQLIPDLAFALAPIPLGRREDKRRRLLINVAGLYDQYWPVNDQVLNRKYVHSLSELAADLCLSLGIEVVEIFTTNLIDIDTANRFVEEFSSKNLSIDLKYEIPSSHEVTNLIRIAHGADFILSTRLHAAIIAILGGCEAFAVSYQDKVKNVLIDLGVNATIINLDSMLNGSLKIPSLSTLNYGVAVRKLDPKVLIDQIIQIILKNEKYS